MTHYIHKIYFKKDICHIHDRKIPKLFIDYASIARAANLDYSTVWRTFNQERNNPETIRKIYDACRKLYGEYFRPSSEPVIIPNNITQSQSLVNS